MAFGKGFKRKASGNAQKRKGGRSYAIWKAANSQEAAVHADEDVPPADQANIDVALGAGADINRYPAPGPYMGRSRKKVRLAKNQTPIL